MDIFLYLQSEENLAINKIKIIKYFHSLFLNVDYNSEILMRKFVGGEEKLNLYQIRIYQYILYQNPINSKDEEEKYRSELHNLLILLLSKISLNKEIHHYIFSILMNFSNKTTEKMYFQNNNNFHDESKIKNHSAYLSRFLELLKIFYNFYNKLYDDDSIPNYFFFNGENSSSITIPNKENQKKIY